MLGPLHFKVRWSRYRPEKKRLEFSASGTHNGIRFTAVTDVHCAKEPASPENVHLVALLRLTEIFSRPSASGR